MCGTWSLYNAEPFSLMITLLVRDSTASLLPVACVVWAVFTFSLSLSSENMYHLRPSTRSFRFMTGSSAAWLDHSQMLRPSPRLQSSICPSTGAHTHIILYYSTILAHITHASMHTEKACLHMIFHIEIILFTVYSPVQRQHIKDSLLFPAAQTLKFDSPWSFLIQSVQMETPPLVISAASVLKELCYKNKDELQAGFITAGWDRKKGPQVRSGCEDS